MTTRTSAPAGAPCWVDLMTTDTARARAFYTQLFGWQAEEPNAEFGGYFNFTRHGVRIAGCMQDQQASGTHDVWSIYLAVGDAAATIEAARARGSQVIVPPMPVGDLGTMGVFTDAGGAVVGIWQPGSHKGFGVLGEPGAPAWFELYTRDFGPTVEFYEDVLGWTTTSVSDTPDFRYRMLVRDEGELAGIMDAGAFLPAEVPAHWAVYFGVEDTDAAVAAVTELGGAVVQPPEDSPYGRLATVTDPNGAMFKVVAAPSTGS